MIITYQPRAVHLRDYEQLFTGTNQEFGYQAPFLAFEADTTLQILKADQTTYFHYPNSSEIIPLSTSNLVIAGAIAGEAPYSSDKIWKKTANYKKNIWWGNSTQPQVGIWLCSWLSGSFTGDPSVVWMDRWYNPGVIDSTTALYISSTDSVYDEPSVMTLDPGVWYKYFHLGDESNESLINSLTGASGNLKLHLNDWTQNPVDLSPYDNTTILNRYSPTMLHPTSVSNANDTSLYLQDNQSASVLYNEDYELTERISVSIWSKIKDWNNVSGNHILSKNFRGGWSIGYNNGFYNPTFSMFSSSGTLIQGNVDADVLFNRSLPGDSIPIASEITSDLYTWILDNGIYEGLKHLYKVDFNGNIESAVYFDSSVELADLTLDSDENIWVLESNTSEISGFKSDGSYITTQSGDPGITKIEADLNNTIIGMDVSHLGVTNDNISWYVSANSLWLADDTINPVYSNTITDVVIDSRDTFWILDNTNKFYNVNTDGELLLSGSTPTTSQVRNISLTNEIINTTYEDVIWISSRDDQVIYKYDINGNKLKKKSLSVFDILPDSSNFTSYDWNRKFNYIPIDKTPKIESSVFLGTQYAAICGKQTLSFDTSALAPNEWHLFSFTYDGYTGDYKFYIDSIERDTLTVSPCTPIYYRYENSLTIGADNGKILTLGEELSFDNYHLTGFIDDIRIYQCILTNADLWHIYMNKYHFEDIDWNMSSGLQNYIEEIERFFKFKMPGSKSQYFNIRLIGLNITDLEVRKVIEDIISDTVKKISPAYTELYKIKWD